MRSYLFLHPVDPNQFAMQAAIQAVGKGWFAQSFIGHILSFFLESIESKVQAMETAKKAYERAVDGSREKQRCYEQFIDAAKHRRFLPSVLEPYRLSSNCVKTFFKTRDESGLAQPEAERQFRSDTP